ncbi:hypothetical protein K440DRAFT_179538 [Wilcoxina mikolae CBS 423.85]|nr:hypothetical protein K440DRAFT_179538 [Wilcoxina mikolae CBS 423.85]
MRPTNPQRALALFRFHHLRGTGIIYNLRGLMSTHHIHGIFSRTEPAYILVSSSDENVERLHGFCNSIREKEFSGWQQNGGVTTGLQIKFPGIHGVHSVEEMLFLANEYGSEEAEEWVKKGLEAAPKLEVVDGKIRLNGIFKGKGEPPVDLGKGKVKVEDGRVKFQGLLPLRKREDGKIKVGELIKRAVIEDGKVRFESVKEVEGQEKGEKEKVEPTKHAVVEDGKAKFEEALPPRKEEEGQEEGEKEKVEPTKHAVVEDGKAKFEEALPPRKEEEGQEEGEKEKVEPTKHAVVEDGKAKFEEALPPRKEEEGQEEARKEKVEPAKHAIIEDGRVKFEGVLPPPGGIKMGELIRRAVIEDGKVKFEGVIPPRTKEEQKPVFANEHEKSEIRSIQRMIEKDNEREAEKRALQEREKRNAQNYTPKRSPIKWANHKKAETPQTEGEQPDQASAGARIKYEWQYISKHQYNKDNEAVTDKPKRKIKIHRYEIPPTDTPPQDMDSIKPQADVEEDIFPPPPPPGFGPPPIRRHPVNDPVQRLVRKHYTGDP